MRRLTCLACGLGLLAGTLPAQTTWIVDANNSPGTHFTDLPPAIAAAADGDTITIRAGSYTGGSTGKALTLLGVGKVVIPPVPLFPGLPIFGPSLEVKSLPAGKTFVVAGIQASIHLEGNAGSVHLQNTGDNCTMTDCSSVTITGGTFEYVSAVRSTLAVAGAVIDGPDGCDGGYKYCRSYGGAMNGAVAMRVTDSTTYLSRTDVLGGHGSFSLNGFGSPAIVASGGTTIVTGDGTTRIAGGAPGAVWGPPTPAIQSYGATLHHDTNVALVPSGSSPAISGIATVVSRRIPSLTGQGGTRGGTFSLELVSPAGDAFWVVGGVATTPLATPLGDLFLGPSPVALLGKGVQSPGDRFSWSHPIPNDPSLRAGVFGLQAATLHSATQVVEYSNPVVLIVE